MACHTQKHTHGRVCDTNMDVGMCCLENLMDRGAWWDTVQGVTKNRMQLSD